jgi:hypothetical protein
MVFRMLSDGSKTGMVKKKVIRKAVKKLVWGALMMYGKDLG